MCLCVRASIHDDDDDDGQHDRMTVLYEDVFGRDRVVLMGRLLMGFPVALHTHLTGVNRDEVSSD